MFAVFGFSGLTWNIVSISYRQRAIPDAMLGRVNSLCRLLAWGMMPVGLLLSGVSVMVAEGPVSRVAALTLPFWAAAGGGGGTNMGCVAPVRAGFCRRRD